MAKGVWRTIKGRHVYIEDGQSLSDALNNTSWKKKKKEYNKKLDNIEEYNLYKQARENPDSIDPMTEWSTDWEALDRKYANRYSMEKGNEDFVVKGTPKAVSPKEELARIREYDPEYNDEDYFGKEEYEGLMSKQPILNNQIEDMYAKFIRKGWMAKDEDKINDTYHLGNEKKGYYIQFQDYPYHEGTLDLEKHRRTSPKNDVRTWARVWRDGENIYNKERQHKMQARADVAKFLEGEKSYSTLVQSYMKAGFSKAQAEAFAKYQLRRRK